MNRTRSSSACLRLPVRLRANAPTAVKRTTTIMTEPMAMRMGLPDDIIIMTMPAPPTMGMSAMSTPPPPPPRMVGTAAISIGLSALIFLCSRAGRCTMRVLIYPYY